MAHRGGYGGNWQGQGNPNMAPLPSRPGIGSSRYAEHPPAMSPQGYATPSSSAGPASSPGPEVATTLFVGSISPGISDSWLSQLLEACGHLRSLKRASKAFAFAEYADPDSVLRAISVLNGRELPCMGAEASTPAKKLLVKADEKTRRFLEQYEQSRITHANDTKHENHAMSTVEHIILQMRDPNAAVELDPTKPGYSVPDHLKDLPPEELPEESRGTVLSEIEHFRQAAAARDAESKRREAELEKQRASERARRAGAQSATSIRTGNIPDGPQSYRRPVDFHPSTQDQPAEIHREPEEQDEIDHQRKQDALASRRKGEAIEAERSFSVKERQRLARWDRELEREKAEKDRSERDAVALLRKWEDWQDERATQKELFYTDRKRWRQFRASARKREQEADQQDCQAEAQEIVRAREESERFLAQQAQDMAKLTQQQRASGVLVPSEGGSLAPLKLTFATNKNASDGPGVQSNTTGAAAAPVISVLGEPDEDEREKRASRIKHISFTVEPTEEETRAKRQRIAETLPEEATALFKQTPEWEHIDAKAIDGKYRQWVDAEIEDSLGEKVEELVSVVIEALHAHKPALDLVEAVEPVLDDEAEALVAKLWRMILIDSLAIASSNSA